METKGRKQIRKGRKENRNRTRLKGKKRWKKGRKSERMRKWQGEERKETKRKLKDPNMVGAKVRNIVSLLSLHGLFGLSKCAAKITLHNGRILMTSHVSRLELFLAAGVTQPDLAWPRVALVLVGSIQVMPTVCGRRAHTAGSGRERLSFTLPNL